MKLSVGEKESFPGLLGSPMRIFLLSYSIKWESEYVFRATKSSVDTMTSSVPSRSLFLHSHSS